MKKFRAFTIKYIRAINYKPSKIEILDEWNNKRKIISYDYEYNNIYEMAQAYLESKQIPIVGVAETKNGYLLFSENFNILI